MINLPAVYSQRLKAGGFSCFNTQSFTYVLNGLHFNLAMHFFIQQFTFIFKGTHFLSKQCYLPNLIIWSSTFVPVLFETEKAKKRTRERGLANSKDDVNPLNAKLTKWPNTLKQFLGNLPFELFECVWPFCGIGA